jgi:hypothetical protein
MRRESDYDIVRVRDDSYRLDGRREPGSGAVAFVVLARDRLGNPSGWRLRPLVVMNGSPRRLWPTPAEAIAATKLLTLGEARRILNSLDTGAMSASASPP